jgi:hypothetical protein
MANTGEETDETNSHGLKALVMPADMASYQAPAAT